MKTNETTYECDCGAVRRAAVCFLTSRTDDPYTGRLNRANRFLDELRRCFPRSCDALFICSDPDGWEKTDRYSSITKSFFEKDGFSFRRYVTLDGRNAGRAKELVGGSNLMILAGGHVPTQNRFFQKIGLKELLCDFQGVIIGISAGSMNCAGTVYAQPELPGETVDSAYRRFLPGLGLTDKMILPHYSDLLDVTLDGLRVIEDITVPDSDGRSIYAIPDGSYLLLENGKEELRGEAYLIQNRVITRISENEDR